MKSGVEPQTQRFPLGPDMVAEVRFVSSDGRLPNLRDLMHLIAQVDLQRAMLAGETIDTSVSVSTPPAQLKAPKGPVARSGKLPGHTVTFPEPGSKTALGTGKGIVGSLFGRGAKTGTPPTPPAAETPAEPERKTGTDG